MYLRRHPRVIWSAIALLLWAYIGTPLLAESVPGERRAPGGNPNPSQSMPTNTTPAATPAGDSAPPAGNSGAPPCAPPALQLTGINGALQWLAIEPVESLQLNPFLLPAGTALAITGAPDAHWSLNATVTQGQKTPMDTHWNMQYTGKHTHVLFGEISASLHGNDLIGLNCLLRGVELNSKFANGSLDAVAGDMGGGTLLGVHATYALSHSLTVGVSHISMRTNGSSTGGTQQENDQFIVKNITDTYTLTSRPVVAGSEVVTIDGVAQTGGVAYTLDDGSGVLQFNGGSYPPVGSTVGVAYQVALTGARGMHQTLNGVDMHWKATPHLGFDLQAATSAGSTTAPAQTAPPVNINDEMLLLQPGIAVTRQVLYLQHAPIRDGSESVHLNGRLLMRNQDYTINVQSGLLQLNSSALPGGGAATAVLVSYTTAPVAITAPVASAAHGHTAFITSANYQNGSFSALAHYRSTDSGFSPLQPMTNSTVQHGFDWASSYSPLKALTLSTSGDNSLLSSFSYLNGCTGQPAPTGSSLLMARNRNYTLAYAPANWPSFTLQHSSHHESQFDNPLLNDDSEGDSLSSNWKRGAWSAALNLMHTSGSQNYLGPGSQGTVNNLLNHSSMRNDNAALNVAYAPGDRLNLNLNVSGSKGASYTNGVNMPNGGKNYQLTARYMLKPNLSISANVQKNSTAPVPMPNGPTTPGTHNTNYTLSSTWLPSKKVTLSANLVHGGSDYGNNDQMSATTLSGSARWQLGARTVIVGYGAQQFNRDATCDTDNGQSHLLGVGAQFAPSRNTSMTLDAMHIGGLTDASTNAFWMLSGVPNRLTTVIPDAAAYQVYGRRLTALNGSFSYHLGKKQSLSLNGQLLHGAGTCDAGLEEAFGIGYVYHLQPDLTLSLSADRVYISQPQAPGMHFNEFNLSFDWKF